MIKWTLGTILLGVAVIAVLLGVFQAFWDPAHPTNYRIYFAFYVVLLSGIGSTAVFCDVRWRGAFVGATIFAVGYLVFVLRGGFDVHTLPDSMVFTKNLSMGILLMPASLMFSHLLTKLFGPPCRADADSSREYPR